MPPSGTSLRSRLLAVAVAAIAGLAVTGCDLQEDADVERGRALFIEKCGTCHQLAEAATTAQVGPDLDASFAAARETGMDEDTIEGVVQNQIAHPREVNPENPDYAQIYMPPDLVTGKDAEDVARYVATVAGVPDIEPPEAPGGEGGQIYANYGCGACHVLEAAESTGTVGPDLDESLQGQTAAQIRKSIVDPNAVVVAGFPADTMPQNYEEQIPPDELEKLVDFLFRAASGSGDAPGAAGNGGGGVNGGG